MPADTPTHLRLANPLTGNIVDWEGHELLDVLAVLGERTVDDLREAFAYWERVKGCKVSTMGHDHDVVIVVDGRGFMDASRLLAFFRGGDTDG